MVVKLLAHSPSFSMLHTKKWGEGGGLIRHITQKKKTGKCTWGGVMHRLQKCIPNNTTHIHCTSSDNLSVLYTENYCKKLYTSIGYNVLIGTKGYFFTLQ